MPTYLFRCPSCGRKTEEVRRIEHRDDPHQCLCRTSMDRIIASNVSVHSETTPGYMPAFGKRFESKRELRDHIRDLRSEGQDIVEVGNEREAMSKLRPAPVKVDTKAAYDALRKLSRGR